LRFFTSRATFCGSARIPVPANERKFMQHKTSAVRQGGLKTGKNSIFTASGARKF
jgi:hypothetical protein